MGSTLILFLFFVFLFLFLIFLSLALPSSDSNAAPGELTKSSHSGIVQVGKLP